MIWPILALSAALAASCAAYFPYRTAFRSPLDGQNDPRILPVGEQYEARRDEMLAMIDALARRPFEQVSIRSRDGLRLAARYYFVREGAPLAICFHGYRGVGIRDFCGGAQFCLDMGQNVLLVDQRAHGASEGRALTFGVKERLDCLDWVRYAVARWGDGVEICLYGISMGAATVLLASGSPLPANVRAVIADSPYSSARGILRKVCRDRGLPAALLDPLFRLGACLFGHFSLSEGDALAAVRRADVPILILHGEDDRFVPCQMSREIRDAAPEKVRLLTFPGAGHGLSYLQDAPRYERAVKDFLCEALK